MPVTSVALQEVPTQAVNEEMKVAERQMQVAFVAGHPLPPIAFKAQVSYIHQVRWDCKILDK